MIISNSSCLIILDKLDRLTVLKELYGTVTIPKDNGRLKHAEL